VVDPYEQAVLDSVGKFGWHDAMIPEDNEGFGFNYTIGLMETYRHPEVIICGLKDGQFMHSVLWGVVTLIERGHRFDNPGLYDGLLEGLPCQFRPVHPSRHQEYLGYAMWHRRYCGAIHTLEVVQCFWPGRLDGLFPWDPGCSEEVRKRQPLLCVPIMEEEA
jgi:hypothetical protein